MKAATRIRHALFLAVVAVAAAGLAAAADPLPSWNDGAAKHSIVTAASPGKRLALIVHHTDAEREWAYDRDSHIGRLDAALDEAEADGWTIVDMKHDWKRVFP